MSAPTKLFLRGVWLAVGSLALAGCAWLTVNTFLNGGEPPARPPTKPGAEPPKKLTVEEYRQKYPFVSLADRLSYEAERVKELSKTVPVPVMTPDSAKRLEQTEESLKQAPKWDMRRKSLEILHSSEAESFIKREGFGISRMPTPSVRSLELPPSPTISFASPTETESPGDRTPVALPATNKDLAKSETRLPSLEMLGSFHGYGQMNFLNLSGFGFIKDREHVSGFQAHQFRAMPPDVNLFNPDAKEREKNKERWLVSRLELVSLLKHKEPAVYVSKELPRMEDLKNKPTRTLSGFEKKSLDALQNGEDVITDATNNHIRMMGALRASNQCLECHQVRRGDLLGAFSYDLDRDPPVKAKPQGP